MRPNPWDKSLKRWAVVLACGERKIAWAPSAAAARQRAESRGYEVLSVRQAPLSV